MIGAAIGSAIGNIASSAWQITENRRAAINNRDFQREMSNSAHQRAMADLRAAGLNPVLAARQPASTPGGSMAQHRVADLGTASVNSALAAKTAKENVAGMRQTRERAALDFQMERDAFQYYQNNPDKRQALYEAILAKKAGIRPEFGALSGLFRQGNQAGSDWSARALEAGDRFQQELQAMWKRMTKRKRSVPKYERLPQDGDIHIRK